MVCVWNQRKPAGSGVKVSRVVSPGAIIGVPTSMAPSTAGGRYSPCQCTTSASADLFRTSTVTSRPCFIRSSGPGTWPL